MEVQRLRVDQLAVPPTSHALAVWSAGAEQRKQARCRMEAGMCVNELSGSTVSWKKKHPKICGEKTFSPLPPPPTPPTVSSL